MKFLIIIILAYIFSSCLNQTDKKMDLLEKSKEIAGAQLLQEKYNDLKDSFNIWVLNKLRSEEAETMYPFEIDSLLCFNSKKNRFITCRHLYVNIKDATSDDLQFVYGENINEKWYFFTGASIVIPRSLIKGHNMAIPLSYEELHHIALNEVYKGYLKRNGEINEKWFTSHFEHVGWCGRCKTTEDFQKVRLESVRIHWLQRDTTQSIKQLPAKNEMLK